MPSKATHTLLDRKAREAVRKGVSAIYEPVRRTLGPEGRNALLYRTFNRGPRITNDGVTVAEVIEPKDPYVRLAANAFKEMAKRTNERVGDGTTTTIVIGGALSAEVDKRLEESQTSYTAGRTGVMTLRKEILAGADMVKDLIKKTARKIETKEQLHQIATVSVEDPELGKTIADLVWETGPDGFVDVVEGHKGEIETEVIRGMRFPAKVPGKVFVNNPAKYEMVCNQTHVLITNYALDNANTLGEVLRRCNAHTSKIVVIAPEFSDGVLISAVSAIKQGYHVMPVKAPGLRTEQMQDLATYCGAKLIDKATGKKIENVAFSDLGYLDKLVVKDSEAREDAVAIGGEGATLPQGSEATPEGEQVITPISERIKTLKGQLEETKDIQFRRLLERRIASMASAIGVVRVSAPSDAETLYLKLKVEDAVYACRAALRGGYVKGGGLCLKEISDQLAEGHILKEVLKAPFNQIQENAGGALEIPDTVIDPADVVYFAVEHGTSVIAHLATVDAVIPEEMESMPGDGERSIASSIMEFVLAWKRKEGLLDASKEEMERDRLTIEERLSLDS